MSDLTSEPEEPPIPGPSEGGAVSSTGSPTAGDLTPFTDPTPFTGSEPGALAPTGDSALTDPASALPTPAEGSGPPPVTPVKPPAKGPRQTLAGRVWVAIACAAILLVLIIIFIAENSRSVTISFVGAHGHIALGLAMLIAVVAGIVITLLVGSARIVQLTLEVRRHRRRLRNLT